LFLDLNLVSTSLVGFHFDDKLNCLSQLVMLKEKYKARGLKQFWLYKSYPLSYKKAYF